MADPAIHHSAESAEDAPVIYPGQNLRRIGDTVSRLVLERWPHWSWWAGFAIGAALTLLYLYVISALINVGLGLLGNQIPVAWGFPIALFAWWIGIAHAGLFLSAILLLLHKPWRVAINRFAEAMALFASANAGLMPILHLGRPWYFYWLIPYPNLQDVYPQFRSPLAWDVFAIIGYMIVALIFWYLALVPDLATMRVRAKNPLMRRIFGIFSLGWRNSMRHWTHWDDIYIVFSALALVLVIFVASIGAYDFAVAIIPGYHSTMYPFHFIAGSALSGMAMIITIAIPLRAFFGLKSLLTMRHIDGMAKFILLGSLLVSYGYVTEFFSEWYQTDPYVSAEIGRQSLAPAGSWFWAQILCNALIPQLLWFQKIRDNPLILFIIAIIINVGMWAERYVIVIESLQRTYPPSMWGDFSATGWDWAFFAGSLGFFAALLFLAVRLLPALPIYELRQLWQEKDTP